MNFDSTQQAELKFNEYHIIYDNEVCILAIVCSTDDKIERFYFEPNQIIKLREFLNQIPLTTP